MTDEPRWVPGLGPRERRWFLAFLVLGSAYFAVLLLDLVLSFLSGFSQILLILFLAWLLAFVMSPVAHFYEFQGRLSRRKTLKPGPYRLTLRATDAAGNTSKRLTARIQVLPRKHKRG